MNMLPNRAETRKRLMAEAAKCLANCKTVPAAVIALENKLVADRLMLRLLIEDFLTATRETEMRGGGLVRADALCPGAPATQPDGDGEGQRSGDARNGSAPPSPPSDEATAAEAVMPRTLVPSASSPSKEPPAMGYLSPGDDLPAGSSPSDAAAGHSYTVALPIHAPAASPHRSEAGHGACDTRVPDARPAATPIHDRSGRAIPDAHSLGARPVVKPNPTKRTLASVASVQHVVKRSLLDTYRVRDGRPIGDLLWRELVVLARENETEGRVLRAIAGHVANANPEAKVRTIIKAEVVEAAIREAKELTHVA